MIRSCLGPIWCVLGLALMASLGSAWACTTFCLRNGEDVVFARNYDWHMDDGMLIVNKRNISKMAFHEGSGQPLTWTSNYGSVTFNQYGRDSPCGGINEKGLVVEVMWLDETRYPGKDSRPVVESLQWVQYHLDTAQSVAELIAADNQIRIDDWVPIHFLVADVSGAVAAIEYIGGARKLYMGDDLPHPALANSNYSSAVAAYNSGAPMRPHSSHGRFAGAASQVKAFAKRRVADAVDYAFEGLAQVAVERTQWRVVYDVKASEVYFETKGNQQRRHLKLSELDFSCVSPVMMINLGMGSGNLLELLRPYETRLNLRQLKSSYAKSRHILNAEPDEVKRRAQAPEWGSCNSL